MSEGWSVSQKEAIRKHAESFGVVMTKLAFEQTAMDNKYGKGSAGIPDKTHVALLVTLKKRYEQVMDEFVAGLEAITKGEQ